MDLKERLTEDMKSAMKARDKRRLSAIRMLLAQIKNAEIAKKGDLSDEEILAVVSSDVRKRRESIEEYGKGGREDLVEKETVELAVVEEYMPQQISADELRRIVADTIAESGASSPADLGKVMGMLMPKVKGKADGKQVNQLVREMLEQ